MERIFVAEGINYEGGVKSTLTHRRRNAMVPHQISPCPFGAFHHCVINYSQAHGAWLTSCCRFAAFFWITANSMHNDYIS